MNWSISYVKGSVYGWNFVLGWEIDYFESGREIMVDGVVVGV